MEDDTPIYDTLFDMTVNLCEMFPAYTPTAVRRERSREVFLMISRLNNRAERKGEHKDEAKVIRKKAGNNWF